MSFMDWLAYYKLECIRILTKADKLSKTKQIKQHKAIAAAMSAKRDDLILFSAKSRQGKEDIWRAIEKLL